MSRALRAVLIITAALCVPVVPFVVIGELPGERWLSAFDDRALAFALAGAGLLAGDALLPIPSSIVGTMLGARLGFGAGFAAIFIGLVAGQVVAYAASRWLLRSRNDALPATPTLVAVFLSRPVPVLAEALAIAAGAARMRFGQFLLACGSGNLVYAAALAGNGATLVPGEVPVVGLVLPMLLPVAGWLAWRATRRAAHPRG